MKSFKRMLAILAGVFMILAVFFALFIFLAAQSSVALVAQVFGAVFLGAAVLTSAVTFIVFSNE